MRRHAAVSILVFALGCSGGSDGSNSPVSPTPPVATPSPTPTPQPTPAPPPAPAIAQIAGTWKGSFEVQLDGIRFLNTMTLTLTQSDRVVRGTWRTDSGIRTPQANPWFGDITGTLLLNGIGETTFTGSTTLTSDNLRGVGACYGNVALDGAISSSTLRWLGPNIQSINCANNAGGIIWNLSRDGSSTSPPPAPSPTPSPTPQPGPQLTCTASSVTGAEPPAATTITFNESEIAATWTETYAEGSYAACPLRNSIDLMQFSVSGTSLSGRYGFRNLWRGCTSPSPTIIDGGVLQSKDTLTVAIQSSPKPTTLRASLGVDGGFPDTRFDLLVTDETGATASTTFNTSLGRVALSCSSPIANVRISHNGPGWVIDSIAY